MPQTVQRSIQITKTIDAWFHYFTVQMPLIDVDDTKYSWALTPNTQPPDFTNEMVYPN